MDENDIDKAAEDRRNFLKTAGKIAVAAPAAALLLSAGPKTASAQILTSDPYSQGGGGTSYQLNGGFGGN